MKVVVIGGGVAGLAIGWRLAQSGCSVEVLERGLAGRASSWAAAGMLAATAETGESDEPHARFARAGRAAWPAFAAELEDVYGGSIGYRQCGALLIATTDARARVLASMAATLGAKGEKATWLDGPAARGIEPLLSPDIRGALHAPGDAQVDNRILGAALAAAFVRAGGILREHCDVVSLEIASSRALGVVTNAGTVKADKVVIAAGAWSSAIDGMREVLPPVRPAKGQMTALAPTNGASMPSALIWGEEIVYLVPRLGTLLVGATVEDTGFETSVTKEARDDLIARAVRLIPSLKDWRIVESWAGLRPRAPDDAPILGETSLSGLYIASGQFRNGILFTPVIADILRDAVFGKAASEPLGAFAPARFASAQR